jgi:hypothetical protein
VIVQTFSRSGPPRSSDDADYVDTVDELIASGAIPDLSFLWWDARLRPALGTVEVRVMDAQSRVRDITPSVALIQSLARLELEREPSSVVPSAEVLAENRFLAARDGMDARLIDPAARCLISVREVLDSPPADCRPHALALGCADALERGCRGPRPNTAPTVSANSSPSTPATMSLWRASLPVSSRHTGVPQSRATTFDTDQIRQKGAAHVPLARILRLPHPDERRALRGDKLVSRSEPALAARG